MCVYFHIGGLSIPGYGTMIVLGLFVTGVLAYLIFKKKNLCFDDFLIMEAYGFVGAFIGAKLMFIGVNINSINFAYVHTLAGFNELMGSGFVFYGGLIGALVSVVLASKFHKIDVVTIMKSIICLLPLGHAFGRIGCFMAGCCYGIPYDGPFAVRFHEDSFAPSDIDLFPVQLLEAIVLLIIALVCWLISRKKDGMQAIDAYFLMYGSARFFIEILRYDDLERGGFWYMSTSQWVSIALIVATLARILYEKSKNLKDK